MKLNQITIFFVVCAVFTLILQVSLAAVTPEEAAKLKSTLTPLGGEKAGNADNSIPAWDGGYTTVPPGYKSGDVRPDPFANDKPLYSVTGQNMDKYADKLNDGIKFLLKKYPDYRLDVYPTRRSAAAPQFVYDYTFQNATRARTKDKGLSIEGAYCGAPFPIPKNGYEVIWNHLTAFRGITVYAPFRCFLNKPDGTRVLTVAVDEWDQYPYYMHDIPYEKWNGDYFLDYLIMTAPPFKAGECITFRDPVNMAVKKRIAWQYLAGQRRVRRAPSLDYDTPDFVASGQDFFDEAFIFNGALDRYEWKLLGKKEMIIPYNCNRYYQQKIDDVLKKGHANPDFMRWELHRVWVVEATLAPGKRHVVPKRLMYLDEDTWRCALYDGWDAKGALWRSIHWLPLICMELPAVVSFPHIFYEFQSGIYMGFCQLNEMKVQYQSIPPKPDNFFTGENLASRGVR